MKKLPSSAVSFLAALVVVAARRDVQYRRDDGTRAVVFSEDHTNCVILGDERY